MTAEQDLLAKFAHGDVAVFVGAGLSKGAKLPGWIELMRPLAKATAYGLPDEDAHISADTLLEIAQRYANKHGLNALITYLRSKLDTTRRPTRVHRLLAGFQLDYVFTTNYDDMLERAFESAGRPIHSVVTDIDVPFWSEAQVQVVKLCGSLDRPDSLIVTREQFQRYFIERKVLARRLRASLESRTALFLGYSLKDPFFNQIWDNIGLDFGSLRRRGYAVMFGVDRATREDLAGRGITVINLRARGREITPRLERWLRDMQNSLARQHGGSGLAQKPPKRDSPVSDHKADVSPPPPDIKPGSRKIIRLTINGESYQGWTVPDIFEAVLRALVDQGYLATLAMPVATSSIRYLIATDPTHPTGNPFARAVSYGGYHLEANKSRAQALADLRLLVKKCGLSIKVQR